MISNSKKRVLIALYHDYHLFGYFEHLVPLLLKDGFAVTVLTCDSGIVKKFRKFQDHSDFTVHYARYLNPVIRWMENPVIRPFCWVFGWGWSYFAARGFDAVILPRDSKPFQHMIGTWIPAIVCQPGLGNDDKRYIRHIHTGKIPFPIPEVRSPFKRIDRLCGGSYLHPLRGPRERKYYTVTGSDFKNYFSALGIADDHLCITGNPNYEGLLLGLQCGDDELAEIRARITPHAEQKIYTFFASQLAFSAAELSVLEEILSRLPYEKAPPVFAIKIHPRMNANNIEKLQKWAQSIKSVPVVLVADMAGDLNNMRLIRLSDVVLVEDSNVGILAAWCDKPLLVIRLSQESPENIYILYDGILDGTSPEKIPAALGQLESPEKHAHILSSQMDMIKKISEKVESPNQTIVDFIKLILLKNAKKETGL